MKLVIATRESPLALWQANFVKAQLQADDPELQVELLGITTKGDKILNSPLSKIGGKGLFVKELELALLNGDADIAVHSMKDVPMSSGLPPELVVPVIMTREDPRDAFVANHYNALTDLPKGARVGTGALRRKVQILAQRPDLELVDIRGNVNTRLRKLDEGEFDAIILASAGLKRLQLVNRIKQFISQDFSLPAVGQGAIGIECRVDDVATRQRIAKLNDENTAICVAAERAFNARLNGGCQAPIAGYAEIVGENIWLRGLVGDLEKRQLIESELIGDMHEAQNLGVALADILLAQGADEILQKIYH